MNYLKIHQGMQAVAHTDGQTHTQIDIAIIDPFGQNIS